MVSELHYRWDFVGLSTDTKPTPVTSIKVVDGSTFYCSDTSKLYVYCKDNWYERQPLGGTGTTNFNELSNRPKYSGTAMTGETDIVAFTGTDGTANGTAGLVPAPQTTDEGKFLKADGTWDTTGGGTLYTTIGTNTDGAMTQKATTEMIYPDDVGDKICIGHNAQVGTDALSIGISARATGAASVSLAHDSFATNNGSIAIGRGAGASGAYAISIANGGIATQWAAINIGGQRSVSYGSIALGYSSEATADGAIALGITSKATQKGEINIAPTNTSYGWNTSYYRLIRGLYDGQKLHDAATVAQGNTLATSAPTTATEGVLGQLYTDTTNMHTYQCTAIDTTDPDNPAYTWTQRW